jgi:WD40 repeat protein
MYSKTLAVVPGRQSLGISGDLGRLSVSGDRDVRVLDTRKGAVIADIPRHEEQLSAMLLSRDGAWVVTGTSEGRAEGAARIWDVGSARLVATLAGHGKGVTALALSDDGKRLATGPWTASCGSGTRSGARTAGPAAEPASRSSLSRTGAPRLGGAGQGAWQSGCRGEARFVERQRPVMGMTFSPDGRRSSGHRGTAPGCGDGRGAEGARGFEQMVWNGLLAGRAHARGAGLRRRGAAVDVPEASVRDLQSP